MDLNETSLVGLNKSQKEVASFKEGVALVVAVAGSGKTKTMISRAAYLIDQGVAPANIWMTTFTNKAANEIRERLLKLNGAAAGVFVGTFHSLCLNLYRKYFRVEKTVIDQDDIEQSLDMIIETSGRDDYVALKKQLSVRSIYEIMSYSVNTQQSIKKSVECKKGGNASDVNFLVKTISGIQEEYRKFKLENMYIDFDDIITEIIDVIEKKDELSSRITNQCKYLIVDEFQDTNLLQFKLISLISSTHRNVMCVGDDAQSIYSFRGANPQQLEKFIAEFENLKIFKLENNYRSYEPILAVGNKILSNMRSSVKKELVAEVKTPAKLKPSDIVKQVTVPDDYAQTDYILKEVKNATNYDDVCVLVKYGYQGAGIELRLLANKIPYKKYGGLKFLEKRHIKDIISFLKIAINKSDRLAVIRCLLLISKVGPKSAALLYDLIVANFETAFENKLLNNKNLPKSSLNIINCLKLVSNSADYSFEDLMDKLIAGYDLVLKEKSENEEKYANAKKDLEELRLVAKEYSSMASFINDVIIGESGIDAKKSDGCVLVSTIHSIKGLERNTVIIPNCQEGVYPRFQTDPVLIEEEKRLFYVAVTRAKHKLIFIRPSFDNRNQVTQKSSFLA